MPARPHHLAFDAVLVDRGVILEGTRTDAVHDFLDRGAAKWGSLHRELDPNHDAEKLRPWIAAQVRNLRSFRQDTATDYVRAAWGHIVLDHVVSLEKDRRERAAGRRPRDGKLEWDALLSRAWRRFREGGFDRCRYRAPNRSLLEITEDWLFGRGDRARA